MHDHNYAAFCVRCMHTHHIYTFISIYTKGNIQVQHDIRRLAWLEPPVIIVKPTGLYGTPLATPPCQSIPVCQSYSDSPEIIQGTHQPVATALSEYPVCLGYSDSPGIIRGLHQPVATPHQIIPGLSE